MVTSRGDVKVLDFGLARSLPEMETTLVLAGAAGPGGIAAAPSGDEDATKAPPSQAPAEEERESGPVTRLGSLIGTVGYMSPEQARGERATAASDIYSCGLLLQELFTGKPPFERDLDAAARLLEAREARSLPVTGLEPGLTALLTRMKAPESAVRPSAPDVAGLLREIREAPGRRLRRLAAGAAVLLLAFVAAAMTWQAFRIRKEARRANREAATAGRVSGFLVNLFEISDPGETRGNRVTARELLDKASREIEGELKEEPAVQGTLLYAMSNAYAGLGLYPRALELSDRALARLRAATPVDEVAIGKALAQSGVLHRHLGEHEKAGPLYLEALATLERALGPDHPEVGKARDNYGVFLQETAKYAEAEAEHKRALAILERADPRSRDVATALTNLANVYNTVGKYDAAESLQRRALEIQERLLGPDHPEVAFSLNALATLSYNLERYEKAEELFRRVLAVLEKVQGKDHPDIAVALNNLANVAQARGDYATAEVCFLRAIEIVRNGLGPGHPSAAVNESNLATVYRDLGRYSEAEALQRRALDADRRIYGNDHPNAAFDLHRLSMILRETGRAAEAEPSQRQAVAVLEKALGPDHPSLALALMVLADLARAGGDADAAETTYRRALAISEKALGAESGDATDLKLRLAAFFLERGRGAEAAPLLAAAVASCEEPAALRDPNPYQMARHGTALLLSGRTAEARPVADRLFATGYRRRPFVDVCARSGIRPR
jgi:tetratricopeptide (TPR) repeat protein